MVSNLESFHAYAGNVLFWILDVRLKNLAFNAEDGKVSRRAAGCVVKREPETRNVWAETFKKIIIAFIPFIFTAVLHNNIALR